MTDKIRRSGEVRLDFAFGAAPQEFEAETSSRLADLRRRAAARHPRMPGRGEAPVRHVRWRDGVARIRDV